ncbi:MAG: hypothetical protein JZU55_17225, partial [Afipia sp.]|nr:hypothetical protein [Afipia sp.]
TSEFSDFQAEYEGSIPFTRSIPEMPIVACAFAPLQTGGSLRFGTTTVQQAAFSAVSSLRLVGARFGIRFPSVVAA